MTTLEWLNQALRLDEEIDSLQQSFEDTKTRAATIAETVPDAGHDELESLSDLIGRLTNRLIRAKSEIISAICHIDKQEHRLVLILRHVDGKTWDQIAAAMRMSSRHVQRLHIKAIAALEAAEFNG